MSPFLDRSRRADPQLEAKVWIFSVAAVLGLCGIYFDERWMGAVAIALLAGAILLRFARRPGPHGVRGAHDDDDDEEDDAERPRDRRGQSDDVSEA